MTLTRRGFLGQVAPAAVAPFLPGCGGGGRDETRLNGATGEALPPVEAWPAPPPGTESPFLHGVASGDPTGDAVVLWTRVTPQPAGSGNGAGAPDGSIEVEWRIATDPELQQLMGEGSVRTDASADHTVHVDATGLASDTTYYFQFRALGVSSDRGRTRTLPTGGVERMRLAVVSCANYPAGFFNVYALIAQADIDFVLHLGDYLYEYQDQVLGDGAQIGRAPDPPRELLSLEDYRRRHAQYKTDPDLRALHRQHPFIAVWDDHDVANDAFQTGAQNHTAQTEGDYQQRKQSALQAYREWMPLRPSGHPELSYRSFACGDLLDLVLLDTRHAGREQQLGVCDVMGLAAPARQLLGADQEAWLGEQLLASQARGTRWRVIGQQVLFAPLRPITGCVVSSDNWDGYPASRTRLLDALDRGGVDNVVLLTGDAHSAWGIDVPRDPFDARAYDPASGLGSRLVEFVTPAVSSPARGRNEQEIRDGHPHVKFVDQTHQGYLLVDITRERVLGEWYRVATVREQSAEVELGALLQTLAGQPHLVSAAAPSVARAALPAPAR